MGTFTFMGQKFFFFLGICRNEHIHPVIMKL
jgi:hypothetical protein